MNENIIKSSIIAGMQFQHFVLRFVSLKNRGFGFAICVVFFLSSRRSTNTLQRRLSACIIHLFMSTYSTRIYNHCGLLVILSFIDSSLLSTFATFCIDGVKAELKDSFIKHCG